MQLDEAHLVLQQMHSNAGHFAQSSTPQNVNMSLQVKKGGTLNNSFLGTANMGPHLILQNYHGNGYPPMNQMMTKSPQNANNYAPLSPMYGASAKQHKQQVSSVMEKNHGNMMIQPGDLSLMTNKYSTKLTSGQKKRTQRGKSKQSQNMSHEVGR